MNNRHIMAVHTKKKMSKQIIDFKLAFNSKIRNTYVLVIYLETTSHISVITE